MDIIKLLFAEDEKRLTDALSRLLSAEGYEVTCVHDGEAALRSLLNDRFDVVILDVMMPKLCGYEVASRIRREGIQTPILMLTAKGELSDKVEGLDAGADDYLTKPFLSEELFARLRALTRRSALFREDSLSFGDILLKKGSAELFCTETGRSVRLGEKELRILEYMLENKGQILTKEQLSIRIWGYENEAEYNKVEVYMSFTRKKLSFVGAKTAIKAVRGIGYELREQGRPV